MSTQNCVTKYVKKTLKELKGEIDKSIIIIRDFNNPLQEFIEKLKKMYASIEKNSKI